MPSTGPFPPHGFQEQFFAALETAYDTDLKPASADAILVNESSFEPEEDLVISEEKGGTRMPTNVFKGAARAKGSCSFYVKPAAAGTEPDYGAILEAAFHDKTFPGGTSVSYAVKNDAVVKSLRLHRGVGDGLMESMYGVLVEAIAFEIMAGQPSKITPSFVGARLARAKSAVLTGAIAMGAGSGAVAAGEGERFEKGTTIAFKKAAGTYETNGGLGYLVTSDAVTPVTFTPVAVSAMAIGDEIVAYSPAMTTGGNVVSAVDNIVTVDGVSFNFTGAKVNVKTGLNLRREAQTRRPTGGLSGGVDVDFEIEAFMREDQVGQESPSMWDGVFRSVVIQAGPASAAARQKLNIANVALSVSPVRVPAARGAASTFTLRGVGKTAFTVVYD